MADNSANDTLSQLDTLDSIEQDIHTLLERQEGLMYADMVDVFDEIKMQLLQWMENAHLIVFAMEQKAKDGAIMSSTEVVPLQERMAKMEGVMGSFTDVSDSMDGKFDHTEDDSAATLSTKRMTTKVAMAKVQSEWSGLYHFMLSVTKQMETAYEKHELLVMMQTIMLDIDNLTSTIFRYQEKRHLALTRETTPIMTENGSGGDVLSTSGESLKDEALLSDLDHRVNPVFLAVEKVYARMNSSRPPGDDSGILVRKHRLVQEKWECLRIEIDELKDELKEDRWLAVFRQVADQVDTMINGLDKTVQECYNFIQQIYDWHDPTHQQHSIGNAGLASPQSPSTLGNLSKTFSRSVSRNHSYSSASSTSTTPPPFDRKKFKSIEKNFEIKYANYPPSIDRMLTMLGDGITSRMTKDRTTCERQSAMVLRWQQLKAVMDHLRLHDLLDAERYLMETPISPASSVQSDKSHHRAWNSIRRRTSDQECTNLVDFNHSKTRAASITNEFPRMNQSTSQHEDYRRVRSVTPSSGTYQRRDNHHRSTKLHTRQQQQHRAASPLNFSSHPSTPQYNRILRPSTSETSSADSKSTSSRHTTTGRKSLTPIRPAWSTSIKPSKHEFSTLAPLWKGESRVTTSGLTMDSSSSFARHQQRRKSHVPQSPSAQHSSTDLASFMKPTKSTMLRKRPQSVEPPDIIRSKTPTRAKGQPAGIGSNSMRRTKTPTTTAKQQQYHLPPRPKSSLARQEAHDMLPYVDRERRLYDGTKSPTLRSDTPSLIPRPKTASGHHQGLLRFSSPSMVPRPRSSMRLYQQDGQAIPPVPPLPSNLERPSIRMFKQ
ncbi:hypothetical protein BCR42DRAFT_176614 [Absidia repens]|uniref:Karyogamy protein n=1 Tax=Absidia repens TaxID=90262 RepID=A0A1X2HZ85_9FUNG|nr:hypothetical protein BCR42DRAFT_176614 [Absidia repens]